MRYFFSLILISIYLLSCSKSGTGKLDQVFMGGEIASVSRVTVSRDSITIIGTSLDKATSIKVKRKNQNPISINLVSQSGHQLIGKLTESLGLVVGEAFSLIIDTASGSSTIDAIFTLAPKTISIDSLIGVLGTGGVEGDTIIWDARTNSWKTAPIATQSYLGSFDASTALIEPYPRTGDYYIINKSGVRDLNQEGAVSYSINDKIVFNGRTWDLYKGAGVASFNGRTGAIIPTAGDYSWSMLTKVNSKILNSKLNDINGVDFTIAPTEGDVLTYSGDKWISKPLAPVVTFSDISGTMDTSKISNFSNSVLSTNIPIITIISNPTVIGQSDNIGSALSKIQSQISRTDLSVIQSASNIGNISSQLNLALPKIESNTSSIVILQSDLNKKLNLSGGIMTGDLNLNSNSLKFNSGSIAIKSPVLSSPYIMTLPNSSATIDGQVLTSNTLGELRWTTPLVVTKESLGLNVDALQRSNHQGTQLASTVSDFGSAVLTTQPIVSPANGPIVTGDTLSIVLNKFQGEISTKADYSNQFQTITTSRITGLISPPIADSDAISKSYLDGVLANISASASLLNTQLSGLNLTGPINVVISATDSILSAFQKIQTQIFGKADLSNLSQQIIASKLSLGTSAFNTKGGLAILNDSTVTGQTDSVLRQDQFSNSPLNNGITFRSSRGTPVSPSPVLVGDVLGFLGAKGSIATTIPATYPSRDTGILHFDVTENWTESSFGTNAGIALTPNGSVNKTRVVQFDSKSIGGGIVRIAGDAGELSGPEMGARLDVHGSAITRTYNYSTFGNGTGGGPIDMTKSNSIAILDELPLTSSCGTSCPTLADYAILVADGGTYTLAFQNSDRSWNLNYNFYKAEGQVLIPSDHIKWLQLITKRTIGKHLIMSISRIGEWVYVAPIEI
jgi:hypothetical protein